LARRRGALLGVGLALVALGALAFLFVSARMNETSEVIAVVNDLERGSLIGAEDVAVASMVADPRLAPVPADRIEDVIGLRASTDLVAGTFVDRRVAGGGGDPRRGSDCGGCRVDACADAGRAAVGGRHDLDR
jgi:hypothetical protein